MYDFRQQGPLQAIGNTDAISPVTRSSYDFSQGGPLQAIGALPGSTWCSNTNPQEDCRALTNICKPMDEATLEVYKGLQRQLNRLLKKSGSRLLMVDGRIGPKTLAAINTQTGRSYSHCDEAAANADAILLTAKGLADSTGAAIVADPPRSKAIASKVDPATDAIIHPDVYGAGFLGLPWWAVIAVAAGGYLIYTTTGPAKKKRAAKRRRKPAVKRRKPAARRRKPVKRRRKPKSRTTVTRYY